MVHSEAPEVRVKSDRRWLYFMQTGGLDGPVKIGYTDDVERRMVTVQTGCPYRVALLFAADAEGHTEPRVKALLREGRIRGEWFRAETVLAYLAEAYLPLGFLGDCLPDEKADDLRRECQGPFDALPWEDVCELCWFLDTPLLSVRQWVYGPGPVPRDDAGLLYECLVGGARYRLTQAEKNEQAAERASERGLCSLLSDYFKKSLTDLQDGRTFSRIVHPGSHSAPVLPAEEVAKLLAAAAGNARI